MKWLARFCPLTISQVWFCMVGLVVSFMGRFLFACIVLCSPKMAGRGDAEVEKKVVDKEGNGGAVET